jgi:hypothetical protein
MLRNCKRNATPAGFAVGAETSRPTRRPRVTQTRGCLIFRMKREVLPTSQTETAGLHHSCWVSPVLGGGSLG